MHDRGPLPAGSWSRRRLVLGAAATVGAPLLRATVPGVTRAQALAVRVPILTYHSVDYGGSQYSVTPEQLTGHCQWLTANGYSVVSLSDFWAAALGGMVLPANPVVLTNDDGYLSALHFAEILALHGMRATYFVNNLSPVTPEHIALLGQYGSVQAHTVSHVSLPGLAFDAQLAEIAGNRSYLEGITGQPVVFLAWPFGASDDSAAQAAAAAGIIGALGLGGTAANTGVISPYALPRIMIEVTDTIESFAAKVSTY